MANHLFSRIRHHSTDDPAQALQVLRPLGHHIRVVDIHDESTAWLQPYEEVQHANMELPD